jgi:lysophospholipase L1-like esterase
MVSLFFGDSLTEGSNSNYNFTDFLEGAGKLGSCKNRGVGGTTIGEYSIYPVDGNSLLSQIEKYTENVREADYIFIEYGSNDVSAVMCGFATVQTVVVSFVKAVDWIKQINQRAQIVFLAFCNTQYLVNSNIVLKRGNQMCDYLEHDYFAKFDFKFPVTKYVRIYEDIIFNISKVCDIISMFDEEMLRDEYISDDNIHPNVEGHKRIAENILRQCKQKYFK